jgi:acyl-coenzyme A thioesterase PaaI-like protein
VYAEAWIRRAGRSVAFMEAELRDPDGAVLATATSTCRIM